MFIERYDLVRYRKIPNQAVRRLPLYPGGLRLSMELYIDCISSLKLSEIVWNNPCRTRKEFSCVGVLETRGAVYHIKRLLKQINKILKLDGPLKAAHTYLTCRILNLEIKMLKNQRY